MTDSKASVPHLRANTPPVSSRSPSPNLSSSSLGRSNAGSADDINLARQRTKESGTDSTHDQTIYKQEWLNRFALPSSALSNFSGSSSHSLPNSASNQHWKLVKAVIQDGSLRLYKPPSDLSIKAFDNDAPPQVPQSLLSAYPPATKNTNASHKRIMSSNSTLIPHMPIPSKNTGPPGSRLFYKGTEAHPDLEYNDRGKIVGGSDEAICHTILFGASNSTAKTSVLLLPLLTDMVSAIDLLTLYSTSVSYSGSNASTIPFSSANHNLSSNSNPPKTPNSASNQLVSRLQLVVETIQDNFPGMLLDNTIFSVFMRLVESVSYHDDSIATDLKMSVFMKQKYMTEMLSYATHQEPIMWSGIQPNLSEGASDRLHYILNRIESVGSNPSSASTNHYTNVNSSIPISLGSTSLPGAIPPDLILDISVETFAKQIYHFHLAFSKDWSPTSDIALLFTTKYNYHRHSPLVFDSTNIHFLGGLLIDHLFNNIHHTDNSFRGKILTYWINLGNSLKNCGDMVGWLSIATVICSLPVLRLRSTWCYVSSDIRDRVIREWAPVVFDLERRLMISDMSRKSTYHVLAPQGIGITYPKERVVPFFGDLCVKFQEGSTYKQCEGRLNSIRTAFERWDSYLQQIPQNDTFEPLPESIPILQKLLYALLSHHYETPVIYPEAILKMSLEVEPCISGQYLQYHYTQRSLLTNGSYLPLIFTSIVPSYSLFSKSVLIAASGALNGNPKRTLRPSTSRTGESFRTNSGHSQIAHTSKHLTTSSSSQSISSNLHRSLSFPPDGLAMTTGYSELDSPSRQFISKHTSRHALMRNMRDVLNVGAKLYHVSDDIVLKAFEDDLTRSSRPSSMIENVKRQSNPASRRVSVQLSGNRRISNSGDNELASDVKKPMNVVVKAANLDRLVDILVLGVDDFSYFATNENKSESYPLIQIDMDAHTLTFFATFRSFCSPSILLESLRKRFVGAQSAAVSISNLRDNLSKSQDEGEELSPSDDVAFPNWAATCEEDPANIDWRTVAQIQIGILEACQLWVSQYFSDFANSLSLRDQFLDLLKTFELELQAWKESGVQLSEEYKVYYDTIEALHKKVRKLFIKKSYRPVDIKRLLPTFPIGTKISNLPLNGDIQTLEQFVDDVDCVVAEYFNMVQLKDWMEIFETLEVQSSDMAGFFHFRYPHNSNDDDVIIQDIFTYFETLYRDATEDRLLFSFPRPIRELFRLHTNLVNYFTVQIGEGHIKKDERVGRMASVLKILGIIKRRMSNLQLFQTDDESKSEEEKTGMSSQIPAFLESAIAAAILRPESRGFANSWIQASNEIYKQFGGAFNGSANTLDDITPEIPISLLKKSTANKAFTPCIGWVLERMLEIVCYVPNMSVENGRLINFDKRRYAYNLIVNIFDMKHSIRGLESLYANGMDSAGVFNFTKRAAYIINPIKGLYHLDRRLARDCASRELKDFPKAAAKNRVFTPYVHAELDKLKRDSRQRETIDRLAKEIKKASSRSTKNPPSVASTSTPSISERKSGLARFGGFFKSVRPISMALSGSFAPPLEKTMHPDDLPDLANMGDVRFKLATTINLATSSVSNFKPTREQQAMFKISSPGAHDIVFQATSDQSAEEWINTLVQAQKQAALLAVMSPTSTKVFGVPVRIVCEREGSRLPNVVDILLNEIEARGLDEVGLYRIPGSLASVNALKAAFDSGGEMNMEDDRWFDINTVTGCFKLYLREIPEPILTSELFNDFVICGNMGNTNDGIQMLRRCVHRLPAPNYNLLKRLVDHLVLVTEHGSANLMHAVNLAIVFSMSFLPNSSSATSVSNDLGAMQTMLKTMILARDRIFAHAQESDADGPLPSQLPSMPSSHHLGDKRLRPPQAPQITIESDSGSSIRSFDGLSRKLSDDLLDTENMTMPLHLTGSPAFDEQDLRLSTSEPSAPSPLDNYVTSRGESSMLSIPGRSLEGRNSNKRFSSLLLASDLAEAGIPTDDIDEVSDDDMDNEGSRDGDNENTTKHNISVILEDPQSETEGKFNNDKRSNRDSFTEVSAY